jgi:F-type H+-transporting ATPase subunit b
MENLNFFAASFSELADRFGLHTEIFISQCIAFLVVALALKKFAYAPVLKVLEDRRQKIAEGIENADKIKAELASTQEAKDQILSDANAKAQELIDEARAAAEKVGEAKAQEAVKQAEEIIRKAREATAADRDTMMAELKAEIGRLVVDTTAKVSGKVLTSEDQQRLIDETNKELAA